MAQHFVLLLHSEKGLIKKKKEIFQIPNALKLKISYTGGHSLAHWKINLAVDVVSREGTWIPQCSSPEKVCNVTIYIIMQRANFNICIVVNLGEYWNPVEVAAGEDWHGWEPKSIRTQTGWWVPRDQALHLESAQSPTTGSWCRDRPNSHPDWAAGWANWPNWWLRHLLPAGILLLPVAAMLWDAGAELGLAGRVLLKITGKAFVLHSCTANRTRRWPKRWEAEGGECPPALSLTLWSSLQLWEPKKSLFFPDNHCSYVLGNKQCEEAFPPWNNHSLEGEIASARI